MKKFIFVVSLSLTAFSAQAADLSASCTTYFEKIDQFVENAAKNPAAAAQLEPMKQQLQESKKQLSSLPKDIQEQSCVQGIEALKQMEGMLPK